MQNKLYILFVLILFTVGCSREDEQTDTRTSSAIIYDRAAKAMADGNYRNATNYLEVLTTSFPFSNEAKQAQLDLIFAYYRSNGMEEAIDEAKQFEKNNKKLNDKVVTKLSLANNYCKAEEYHQKYLEKN